MKANLLFLVAASLTLLLAATPAHSLSPYYTVVRRGHSYWFATPSGKRIWSVGIDCVEAGGKGTADNPHYDGVSLFGSREAWVRDVLKKLKSWGVNTLGGWSDDEDFHGKMPYTIVLHLGSYDKAPYHDLFSAATTGFLADAARKLVPPHKNDPNLVGYFTDNELGWWDDTLFLEYFAMGETAPGKRKLVGVMRDHYQGSFADLKREWSVDANSFQELLSAKSIHLKVGTKGIKAVHEFNFALARRYYSLVKSLIRRYDRNHLILGDRYCQYYNIETARASAPFIDVASTNAGADWLDGSYSHSFFSTLNRLTGKPILVSEYYFSARENSSHNRNSGSAFPLVDTQKERAAGFAQSFKQIAGLPYSVGAHWFQFADEPPKGRGDGEDWNFGFVDVQGREYPEMVRALKSLNPVALHSKPPKSRHSMIPTAPSNPMNDLLHWDREKGYLPSATPNAWADLYLCRDVANLYICVVPMEYGDPHLYDGNAVPESDRPLFEFNINGRPFSVRYGFSKPLATRGVIAESRERPGLKHMFWLRIPASAIGSHHRLAHSGKLWFSARLTSHGRGYTMSWKKDFSLR